MGGMTSAALPGEEGTVNIDLIQSLGHALMAIGTKRPLILDKESLFRTFMGLMT